MANDPILGLDDADSILEMRRRQLDIALRMQRIGLAALAELEAKAKAGEPLNLSAEGARTLVDAGTELERAALKKPDDDVPPNVN